MRRKKQFTNYIWLESTATAALAKQVGPNNGLA